MHFSFCAKVPHAPSIPVFLNWSPKHLLRSMDNTAPHCAVFSTPITSSFLGPNIFLSTLFFKILSLRTSLGMTHQVSHPYKTQNYSSIVYISTLIVWTASAWVPLTMAWHVLKLRRGKRPPDMDSCKYVEQTVADSRQRTVQHLGGSAWR
jgi:hypothetical protein